MIGIHGGHDGGVAIAGGGVLLSSIEATQDSFPRYSDLNPFQLVTALEALDTSTPDAICLPGWIKGFFSTERPAGAGYFGLDSPTRRVVEALGKKIPIFETTHERAHIFGTLTLSPYHEADDIAVLIWEGNIGSFYRVSRSGSVTRSMAVMTDPGNKFQFLFNIADPNYSAEGDAFRFEAAGKMMALASYGRAQRVPREGWELIDDVNARNNILSERKKKDYKASPYYNCGLESVQFLDLAAAQTERIFERFELAVRGSEFCGLPLAIGGGCGLNVTWNTKWFDSGLFESVFVPPCPDDSGIAIGAIGDYLSQENGELVHLAWEVYCGSPWIDDMAIPGEFREMPTFEVLVDDLAGGAAIPLIEGRCEIGPRALGHRSLIALGTVSNARAILNRIKKREQYRPIAPVCRARDASKFFSGTAPAEHMLFTRGVIDEDELPSVTHADGSARLQTVEESTGGFLYSLLGIIADHGHAPVLCNTSLNFEGRGFINRTSDLIEYVLEQKLRGFVLRGAYYRHRGSPPIKR